jgi:anaphase-promoting complex subunit 8
VTKSSLSQSCLFLKNYALFLVSEQVKEEEILESNGSADKVNCSTVNNKDLTKIEGELEEFYRNDQLNGINCYLLGIIYKERNKTSEAKEAFVKSLLQMPMLWTAWLELGSLISLSERNVVDSLCNHWMKNFYFASFYLEIQKEKICIDLSAALYRHFPESVYLRNQIAHSSYQSQEYDIAIDYFKQLLKSDPYRYENLDLYSNILYIKESFGELANLAFNVFHNDKYRPEACCTVGNYYSLRGDHF